MAGKRITVVLSQTQGKNPTRRNVEEEIVAAMIMQPEVDVSVVPHLYDLPADHTGMLFLRSVPGDVVVLGWLYPRAIRWTLDRNGIKGNEGLSLLKSPDEEEEEDEEEAEAPPPAPSGIGSVNPPNRKIYCLDLRDHADPKVYIDEIKRIAAESAVQTVDLMQWIGGNPKSEQLQRYLNPNGSNGSGTNGNGHQENGDNLRTLAEPAPPGGTSAEPEAFIGTLAELVGANGTLAKPVAPNPALALLGTGTEEPVKRRWYPVIDYDRCTNCMECIDFCLFGVYGIDTHDRILVEQQDNCKKGCPACSRVCPENAIIFPEYKTPAIAGAAVGSAAGLKIDLSKLFGAPTAVELAAQERDVELVRDGREEVGMSVGIPKRQDKQSDKPRDELDDLMDGLDDLEL